MNQFERMLNELDDLERIRGIIRDIVKEEIDKKIMQAAQPINIRLELDQIYNGIENQFNEQ
jgi:hypothetical protein